ncbi:IclR family transcriptional regulator [Parapedomonas caeni]
MSGETSVLKRVGAVLNGFSDRRPQLTLADLATLLEASEATAYRYAAELCDIGLLARRAGHFLPGPKIIELDYLIQSYDPVLRAGTSAMAAIAERTGCHVLLCAVYGQGLVNVHHAVGRQPLALTFLRGRTMPLFRGSQARVALAFTPTRKLRRLWATHRDDPDLARLGADWLALRRTLQAVRKAGHYISRGELDPGITGIAAPLLGEDATLLGCLVLAYAADQPPTGDEAALAATVMAEARAISDRLGLQRAGPPQADG